MAELEHFDVLVLGSGQGGQLIAWPAAGECAAALAEKRISQKHVGECRGHGAIRRRVHNGTQA
jgi:pyruvate/2-oxoglutarate dehydrogenase complex dihydrolipoamide dehydrogenase (E3) component